MNNRQHSEVGIKLRFLHYGKILLQFENDNKALIWLSLALTCPRILKVFF